MLNKKLKIINICFKIIYNRTTKKSSVKVNNKTNMILIFSHELTTTQIDDARKSLGVSDFIKMPKALQDKWSNIPPELSNLGEFIAEFKNFIKTNAKIGDVALVQGDFGATYSIVNFCKKNGIKTIYATTKRTIKESMVGDKVVKNSIFEHVKFREFR